MEKVLPIGSIVYLKGGSQKMMILNRGSLIKIEDQSKMFDYSASPYPRGLTPDKIMYFNSENIDKVVFEGYSDEEEERFQEVYTSWLRENKSTIVKGDVKRDLLTDNKHL